MKSYVIITPAYNEVAYIGKTIESVLVQTVKPLLWVIVDDGSTDQTAEIIQRYAAGHPWIHYVYRQKQVGQSYYSSNVYAIFEGIEAIQNLKLKAQNYKYFAVLDADISLPPDYYQQILNRMQPDENLGIASGVYVDRIGDNHYRKVLNDRRSTPKALMVFKKQCYEDIGGFIPMKYGGEDTCACFMARMQGWKVWSFPDVVAVHNKPIGRGHAKNIVKIRFRAGIGEYFLATHPLFFLLKSLRRCVKESPFFIGGLVRMGGYVYAHCMREKRQISDELVRFIHKEQLGRVFKLNSVPTECRVGK